MTNIFIASHCSQCGLSGERVMEKHNGILFNDKVVGIIDSHSVSETSGRSFWERDYYENIIREAEGLDRIREYIFENPANWASDEDFPGNICMDSLHFGKPDRSALD